MKTLKRSLSIILSAVLVMALLAGCGGSSSDFASQFRKATGTKESSSLDSVAATLASKEDLSETTLAGVLEENGYGTEMSNLYGGITGITFYGVSASDAAVIATQNASSGSAHGIAAVKVAATEAQLLSTTSIVSAAIAQAKELISPYTINGTAAYTEEGTYLSIQSIGEDEWIIVLDIAYTAA